MNLHFVSCSEPEFLFRFVGNLRHIRACYAVISESGGDGCFAAADSVCDLPDGELFVGDHCEERVSVGEFGIEIPSHSSSSRGTIAGICGFLRMVR